MIYRYQQVVRFQKLHEDAVIPAKATPGSAGYDLVAIQDVNIFVQNLLPVRTGLRIFMPEGLCALVQPRSGLAFRNKISVMNSPGLIDSDYRGEIKVLLFNNGIEPFRVRKGDRIAQLRFASVPNIRIEEGEIADDTERGVGGFGSTGFRQLLLES